MLMESQEKKKKKKLYEGFGFSGKAAVQILLW